MNRQVSRRFVSGKDGEITRRALEEMTRDEEPLDPGIEGGTNLYLSQELGVKSPEVERLFDTYEPIQIQYAVLIHHDVRKWHGEDTDLYHILDAIRHTDAVTVRDLVVDKGMDPQKIANDFDLIESSTFRFLTPKDSGLKGITRLDTQIINEASERGLGFVYVGPLTMMLDYASK